MHLIVPFAAPASAAGRQTLHDLVLPRLAKWLALCGPAQRDEGDPTSCSPPHERALAQALGWSGGDGAWPFAARAARADGVDTGSRACGLLTPVHLLLGNDGATLVDPATLALDDADARALFDTVQALFASDGYALFHGAPLRWYVVHDSLQGLRCASLDRVVGRNVAPWLGAAPPPRALRRLQNEVQMLLYTHPVNGRREARGLLPVNSFWLSGCGAAQPEIEPPPAVDERLRDPALAEDWLAWSRAWNALDEGPIAALHAARSGAEPARLTLCGESASASCEPASTWQRLRSAFVRREPRALLETL